MTIEAIPVLTKEKFLSWQTRITAFFNLGGVKDKVYKGKPDLGDNENSMMIALLLAKISMATHNNVINSANKDDSHCGTTLGKNRA